MARGLVRYQDFVCVCVCVHAVCVLTGDEADNWAEDSYVILPLGGGEQWEQAAHTEEEPVLLIS